MLKANLPSTVTTESLAAITAKLDEVTNMMSFAVGLNTTDKQRLQTVGRERLNFVQLAMENLRQNPDIIPSYFDSEEVLQNAEIHMELRNVQVKFDRLQRMLTDTLHYTGAKAVEDSLSYYAAVKQASKKGHPGMEDIKTRLKSSLKRTKSLGAKPGNVSENEQAVA